MKNFYCSRCNIPSKSCLIVNTKKMIMIIFFYVPNVHLSVARFLKKLLNQNLENLFQSVC